MPYISSGAAPRTAIMLHFTNIAARIGRSAFFNLRSQPGTWVEAHRHAVEMSLVHYCCLTWPASLPTRIRMLSWVSISKAFSAFSAYVIAWGCYNYPQIFRQNYVTYVLNFMNKMKRWITAPTNTTQVTQKLSKSENVMLTLDSSPGSFRSSVGSDVSYIKAGMVCSNCMVSRGPNVYLSSHLVLHDWTRGISSLVPEVPTNSIDCCVFVWKFLCGFIYIHEYICFYMKKGGLASGSATITRLRRPLWVMSGFRLLFLWCSSWLAQLDWPLSVLEPIGTLSASRPLKWVGYEQLPIFTPPSKILGAMLQGHHMLRAVPHNTVASCIRICKGTRCDLEGLVPNEYPYPSKAWHCIAYITLPEIVPWCRKYSLFVCLYFTFTIVYGSRDISTSFGVCWLGPPILYVRTRRLCRFFHQARESLLSRIPASGILRWTNGASYPILHSKWRASTGSIGSLPLVGVKTQNNAWYCPVL